MHLGEGVGEQEEASNEKRFPYYMPDINCFSLGWRKGNRDGKIWEQWGFCIGKWCGCQEGR